ncbi:MAG: carboxypeptidase-like regulatory domain-containing protein, partial [Prevotella sp.]
MSKKTLSYNQNTWYCKMMLTAILLSLPLMSFFGSAALLAKTVTGVVTSATDNEPLIGVTVKVEGSASGTITDFDGKYSINANPGQTLVFSYIGFVSKSVKVGAANTIDVQLQEDS